MSDDIMQPHRCVDCGTRDQVVCPCLPSNLTGGGVKLQMRCPACVCVALNQVVDLAERALRYVNDHDYDAAHRMIVEHHARREASSTLIGKEVEILRRAVSSEAEARTAGKAPSTTEAGARTSPLERGS